MKQSKSFSFNKSTIKSSIDNRLHGRRHIVDVQELELKLRKISRDESSRFRRRVLSSDEPIIFIGGIPRSGTTLMRAMLDSHPDIRWHCTRKLSEFLSGEETSIIPAILYMREQWANDYMVNVANLSGITQTTLDKATSAFISEIIANHGPMVTRLCNKDPYTASYIAFLTRVFPKSKHILMIRDARATIHSIADRKVPIVGYNRSDFQASFDFQRQCLFS
ncbi:hypothetical protein ANCCAN_11299 [Ancylostoma caninum]|uniref:Protein-tyrosine sulfotransferase n=1 Tax=Ancylostoma caninum TaxID=29170 RepID=A0A368GEF4_ANCCA|nr:hypothetical protein ANCCAN_11299 [Ancylostoma caninum]